MQLKHFVTFIIGVLLMNGLHAQNQNNIQVSNLPYYNFGKGLGLTTPDSIFQFNIKFRIQNRFSYVQNEGKDSYYDGQIRRLRLRFDGFVGNPRFIYLLQLSFAPGDVGEIEEGSNLNVIRDAVTFYIINNHWNVGFGQTKLPGNRQRVNSSGALQLSDRSITNARFNLDRDFGFFANYLNEKEDIFSWNIKTALTTGDGRNFTSSPDNGLAYTAKLELLPFGRFKKDGAYFEGDLKREIKPKLMLSAAYSYNHNAKRQSGQIGDLLFEKRNLKSILMDAVLKYKGFALMASYMNRNVDNPITQNLAGEKSIIYKGMGTDFQASYIFKNNWEIVGSFADIKPHSSIATFQPSQQQTRFGINKYVWEHSFKLQLEAGFDRLTYFNNNVAHNKYLRFQIEMGI